MKIFLDSNIFIDFYQSTNDSIKALEDLKQHKKHFVLTTQSRDEFERNRDNILKQTLHRFQESTKIKPYTTSLIQSRSEFKKLSEKKKEFEIIADSISSHLRKIINLEIEDHIKQAFDDIYNDCKVLPVDLNIIEAAHRRSLCGNPPKSDKKKTIGDEIHWEALLKEKAFDLVIVARDNTFIGHKRFLKEEFRKITGKELKLITDKISDALEMIGKKPSDDIVRYDEEESERIKSIPIFRSPQYIIPTVVSFPLSGANMDLNLFCPTCGSYDTWNGVICTSCGRMKED